ncbi:hypothetical protein ACI6Q2_16165 [Chitinophagaceae bacterium LWZ2-11]
MFKFLFKTSKKQPTEYTGYPLGIEAATTVYAGVHDTIIKPGPLAYRKPKYPLMKRRRDSYHNVI